VAEVFSKVKLEPAVMKQYQQKIQTWIVAGLLVMSLLYSMAGAYMIIKGGAVSDRTGLLWVLAFALLVALWAKNDKELRNEQKPFEYSFFVFLFWPFVLPYHLIRSRGVEGLLMFIGFLAMHELPYYIATLAWVYFKPVP
jgi:hypothetical protein